MKIKYTLILLSFLLLLSQILNEIAFMKLIFNDFIFLFKNTRTYFFVFLNEMSAT